MLHVERLPETGLQVAREGLARRLDQQPAQHLGVRAVVAVVGARLELAGQGRGEAVDRAAGGHGHPEPGDVREGIAVVLVPAGPRRHLEDVHDGDPVVGGSGEVREIAGHRVPDRGDVTLVDGDPQEGRNEGFRHGPGNPANVGAARREVLFVDDRAVAQHEQATGIRLFQQPSGPARLSRMAIGLRKGDLPRRPAQGGGLGRADLAHGEDALHVRELVGHVEALEECRHEGHAPGRLRVEQGQHEHEGAYDEQGQCEALQEASSTLRRRRALVMTETELRLMAAAASMGSSRMPNAG